MADLEQRSGITYYFRIEGEQNAKRFEQHLSSNTKALQGMKTAMKTTADGATKHMKITSAAVEDSAKKVDKSSRKFIQSISGIYAAFVLAPKIAQQFGEALKEGATGKDVRESFENLADSVGVNAERLLTSMKDAARGTITEIELMRQANRAFIAGGAEFALAIPQLFEIARAAAVATGQDVTFVLDSLTKGIAKASIKLIDNAEVYIKVGEAVEEYAEKLGVTVEELDVVSKRQAILQAVLEQGRGVVEDIGDEVDLATDAFRHYETSVDNAKQATAEFFIDLVGPGAAGQTKALADVVVSLSGVIQTLALLKIASGEAGLIGGLLGTGAAAATATKFAGVLKAAIVPVLAFAAGAFVVNTALQKLAYGPLEELTGIAIPDFITQLELLSKFSLKNFVDVASETGNLTKAFDAGSESVRTYYRELNKLVEFSQVTIDAQAAAREELDKHLRSAMGTTAGYLEYIRVIKELNSTLEDGEQAIAAMTLGQYQGYLLGLEWLDLQEKIRMAEDRAAAARERQMERAAEVRPDIERALKDIKKNLEKRKDLYEDYNDDLEDEMRRHARRMEELSIDAAFDRSDAIRDSGSEFAEAETDYQRDVEDAYRDHRSRLEDIERRFQRRMLEIRERYELTVTKAARRRDVLAIINAREQRGIEERDARRDRDEGIDDENRNFQERLRDAIQAHQDSLRELKDSLAEELREIDENLRRRQEKEARAHEARLADMAIRHDRLLKDLEEDIDEEHALIKRKQNYIQGWLNAHPIIIPLQQGGTGSGVKIPLQHGFAGMVEGPQTFQVESGVKEFVYASGNLAGAREAPAPSSAATSAMALKHSIGGGIGVGVSGLSSQVLGNIGPQLQNTVGQAVVDALTAGILSSLN